MDITALISLVKQTKALLVALTQIILHKISFLTAEPYRGYLKVTTNQYSTVIIDLQEQFTKEKIRVIGLKVNKGNSDHTKIEFDLLYPARYEKNELITFWSKDMRVDMISG